jgi:ligand-binding sensor domain-containing protein/two-component sensor histidine kinase
MRRFILLFFLAAGPMTAAKSESPIRSEYSYRAYTMQDGLPNTMLTDLHIDGRGFLWIGTYRGFTRFDGTAFTGFFSDQVLNIRYIRSRGNGVRVYAVRDVYTVEEGDRVRKVNALPDSLVLPSACSADLPEGYFIGRLDGYSTRYLLKEEGDAWQIVLHLPEMDAIGPCRPFLDQEAQTFYFSSNKDINEVYVYDLKSGSLTVHRKMQNVESFVKHSYWGVLAVARDGLYQVAGVSAKKIAAFSPLLGGYKQAVEMKDGSLLIKDQSGIYRFHDRQMEQYVNESAFYFTDDMLLDRDENLWVITSQGLNNYFRFDFKNIRFEAGTAGTALEDGRGDFWLGAVGRDLFRLSGGDLRQAEEMASPFEYGAFHPGSCAAYGALYFPRNKGVMIYRDGRFTVREIDPPLDGYEKVVAVSDKRLLIHNRTHLYLCDSRGDVLRRYHCAEDFGQPIYDLAVDARGRWVMAGYEGVSVVEDSVCTLYPSERAEGRSGRVPQVCLCIDAGGTVWSAGNSSLNMLRGDSLVSVHRFEQEAVQALLPFENNYLLVSTLKALYLVDVRNPEKVAVLPYNHLNGMMGAEPQHQGLYLDSQGMAWLAANDGFVRFDPRKLLRQNTPPLLHLEACQVSADNIRWENRTTGNHRFNNFRFSFLGIKYSTTENIRYRYRLLGFQDEWSAPIRRREVTFNNLPPGHYTFEVYADAGTDESRSETQAVSFEVRPAFWQTVWFPIALIALLMLLTAFFTILFQRKKNRSLLEKLETERELNDLRIRSVRLRAIPHFNSNVLVALEYYITNRSQAEALAILNTYSKFMYRTLSEVDKAAHTLEEELEYVTLYLELEKMRFVDRFDYRVEMDEQVDRSVRLPNMILHTYCENAIKHGLAPRMKQGGNRVIIRISQEENLFTISVEDNGVGRVYAKNNPIAHSTRQGLEILQRQIEIYNRFNLRKIVQQTDDLYDDRFRPAGTRFSVTVPHEFVYQ